MAEEEDFIEFKIIDDRQYSKDHLWFMKLESDEETGTLFKIGVSVQNSKIYYATGYSKKDAEQKAAKVILKKLDL